MTYFKYIAKHSVCPKTNKPMTNDGCKSCLSYKGDASTQSESWVMCAYNMESDR